MHTVFISYSSKDAQYANRLQAAFTLANISSWYAPFSIGPGCDFGAEIGNALVGKNKPQEEPEDLEKYYEEFAQSGVMVVLLSKNYMESKWCAKELKVAISENRKIYVLQIDHAPLTAQYQFLLVDIQRISAYHLDQAALNYICTQIAPLENNIEKKKSREKSTIDCADLSIQKITNGDPYYTEGHTIHTRLLDKHFYLAAPANLTEDEQSYAQNHSISEKDVLLGETFGKIAAEMRVPDLEQLIEESRKKVFSDFCTGSNGCYFNNKKYGIFHINPHGRTEDLEELPILSIDFFVTDYFTHRVMKDVCKKIHARDPMFWKKNLDFTHIGNYHCFLTSLGINLLLLDNQNGVVKNTLLTSRSANSAETYGKVRYSMSVIEGVSLSDYDTYARTVKLSTALKRGLQEELGVAPDMIQADSIRFYDLFVNLSNLEIGVSCSVELKENLSIESSVVSLTGRDDVLEVANKFVVPVEDLWGFVRDNKNEFMPQVIYSIGSYLNSMGMNVLVRANSMAIQAEKFCMAKNPDQNLNGDRIYDGPHYCAIIDGNTPKGKKLWGGLPGDVYVAQILAHRLDELPGELTAEETIDSLNSAIRDCYGALDFDALPIVERLVASVVIFSRARREIWCFGDCQYRINGMLYNNIKEVDILLAGLRSFFITTELALGKTEADIQKNDTGRAAILPFLQRQSLLANQEGPYGYDVLDGGKIYLDHIKKHKLKAGDFVVLASDGYPVVCDTLQESEERLQDMLEKDPLCIDENKGTKGLNQAYHSYDDRSYLSFIVK